MLKPIDNDRADVSIIGVLAIVAGSDTTVTALSSLFYFLISHPDCYQLAQEEVDRVFPAGADALDASKHDQLTYLNACLCVSLVLLGFNADISC